MQEPSTPPRFVDSRYGRLQVMADDQDLIGRFLEHYGEWSHLEVEYLAQYLRRDARVLDIGAFVGTFTLGLAQTSRLGYSCMVESNPAAAALLRTNAEAHLSFDHHVVAALVIDPQAPPIARGLAQAHNAGSASFVADADGTLEVAMPSATTTLAELTSEHGAFDLVKLDVEGMELDLLASCPPLLEQRDSLIWAECNEHPRSVALARRMLQTGRPLTYFAWPSHNPDNHRGEQVPIFAFAYEAGLLLGADTLALSPRFRKAGCIARLIHTVEDLLDALWHTPRWAPREWATASTHELVGVASHLTLGCERSTFLQSDKTRPDDGTGRLEVLRRAEHKAQMAAFRIERLQHALAATSEALLQAQAARDRALAVTAAADLEAAQAVESVESGMHDAIRLGMERDEAIRLRDEAQHALQQRLGQLYELQAIKGSVTWRAGLRLSRLAAGVPGVRRALRRMTRQRD